MQKEILHILKAPGIIPCCLILVIWLSGCARHVIGNKITEKPSKIVCSVYDSNSSIEYNKIEDVLNLYPNSETQNKATPEESYKKLLENIDKEVEAISSFISFSDIAQHHYSSENALLLKIIEESQVNTKDPFSLTDAIEIGSKYSLDLKNKLVDYDGSLGQLQSSLGQFDTSLQGGASVQRTHNYLSQSTVESDTSTYTLSFASLFTSGIVLELGTQLEGQGVEANDSREYTSNNNYYMNLNIPLLKGLGKQNTAADLISNDILVEAELFDITHQASVVMGQVATSYWNYLLRFFLLKAAVSAEQNSYKMLQVTEQLVTNDARPRTALHSLRADWLNKGSQRRLNQQNFIEARESLALSLGIPLHLSLNIPIPTTPFPQIDDTNIPLLVEKQKLIIKDALSQRGDFLANKRRLESLQVTEKQAENELLPNLSFEAGINQWEGGDANDHLSISFRPVEEWENGYSAGLFLAIPLQNNEAAGLLRQKKSQRIQAEYTLTQSARQVVNSITTSLTDLQLSCQALKDNMEALKEYQEAYNDEKSKYMLGISTVTDIINVADQLNAGRKTLVNNQYRLANAIIEFNTSTGQLVTRNQGTINFYPQNFYKIQANDFSD